MQKLAHLWTALVAAVIAAASFTAAAQSALPPFTGYLMVHFTGESREGEQIYMASSTDGLRWTDLNNSQPVLMSTVGEKGVRDPAIVRSPDGTKYWIIATDLRIASDKGWSAAQHAGSTQLVIWESSDLVHWSAPRMANVAGNIPSAGCAWAPEAIWDPASNAYIVYWATISPLNGVDKARIYYSKTTDFRSFTPAQMYIDRPGTQHIIDTQILEIAGSIGGYRYVRASGDGQITFEGSQSILGAWTRIGDISHLGLTGSQVEGPILQQFNGVNQWGLWVDQYATGGGYRPLVSNNMGSVQNWQLLSPSSYNLGAGLKRHGSVLNLTAAEYERVTTQWGTPTIINRIQSLNFPDRYVRHANFDLRIDAGVNPLADSQFRLVKGLANNAGYVSFASVNFPGYYLRHVNYDFVLAPHDGSAQFAADATFRKVPGLADAGASSFQSYNFPDRHIRHANSLLKLDAITTPIGRSDATFRVTN